MEVQPIFRCRIHDTDFYPESCITCAVAQWSNSNPQPIPEKRHDGESMSFAHGVHRYQHGIDYQRTTGPHYCRCPHRCRFGTPAVYIVYWSFFYGARAQVRTRVMNTCARYATEFARLHRLKLPELQSTPLDTTRVEAHPKERFNV